MFGVVCRYLRVSAGRCVANIDERPELYAAPSIGAVSGFGR